MIGTEDDVPVPPQSRLMVLQSVSRGSNWYVAGQVLHKDTVWVDTMIEVLW